ncbi:uncharacterized protein PV09_09746 [Verruconis gallopava]|uniref:PSP proline-rich domain-containing protein n=1 Tax=Verruconis gallopava TaxID=253628 RepID=A0A0D1ZVC6_9PEZI|nr:uncharacterized protein PV09_09746 [Verruconis gallopava]KIV98437.1 hypothetical protein PV09_09746 [Verruconis gallopava]
MSKTKVSKNAFRRQQKKLRKEEAPAPAEVIVSEPVFRLDKFEDGAKPDSTTSKEATTTSNCDSFDADLQGLSEYKKIFQRFQISQHDSGTGQEGGEQLAWSEENDNIPDDTENAMPKKSKKQRKRENKLSVAELKAMARKPELVEWTDADSSDPLLLLTIKSHRNIVPVPAHWSLKREYLSSKRGIEKPPFRLPKFIADTGIAEMRDAALEKQAEQSLKQKQRERVQPKMGRLDIDYAKLYNAFFKFQTKPELTRFGEVYYEGKEFETNLRHLRPGELSDELKEALGMQPGFAPPWLLNMQRFGPPPSYPALRIPGVNCPPPAGSSWGFGPGQYGKPPVDDNNKPLYGGDIFGIAQMRQTDASDEFIDKSLWGELRPSEEDSEEEEEEDEDEEEDGTASPSGIETGLHTAFPSDIGGLESVAGDFNLRKHRAFEAEENFGSRQAYQVLEEQKTNINGFLGSDRKYNLNNPPANIPVLGSQDSRKRKAGDVDVSVDVDTLIGNGKLSKDEIAKQYQAQSQDRTRQWTVDQDDLSQMIAEESRKRLKKDIEKREEKKRR